MAEQNPESTPQQPHAKAIGHITEAHGILQRLRGQLDQHPELEEAIEELELALNELSLRTGGLL